MRVTENMRYASVTNNLSQLATRQAKAAQEAQTGIRVNAPSDDPVAAAELARLSASQNQITARRGTITSVRGDAELAESQLQSASDLMATAKELAVQGANGTLTADQRSSLALQVKNIKDQLIGVANTKGSAGYVFGGLQTQSKPFDDLGAFSGDDQDHLVDIGNSTPTAVNASGAKAFTAAGGRNVFADLDTLYTALNTNDTAGVSGTLDDLDTSRAQITQAQAATGVVINRLDASDQVLSAANLSTQKSTQEVGAADPTQAYSNLTQLNNSLQQSVAVAKSILDISASWR
jgi:flagellar hook-associated protein 3 FlgL